MYSGIFSFEETEAETETPMMPTIDNPAEADLKPFYLSSALNQSIVENALPFGMRRQLKPLKLKIDRGDAMEMADVLLALNPDYYDLKMMRVGGAGAGGGGNRIKFINQKLNNTIPIANLENCLNFDPSAILFFKGSEFLRTNLTSNANGTVSNDKNYLSGVLNNQGCWLICLPDIFKFELPEIQNNKLRSMKYLEFITQEWDGGIHESFGDEVEFVALNVEEADKFKVLMKASILISQKAQRVGGMSIKVIDCKGRLKNEVNTRNHVPNCSITRIPVIIENGDTVILRKGEKKEDEVKNIIPFNLEDDLETKIPCDQISGVKALIISRVHFKNEFDELFRIKNGPAASASGYVRYNALITYVCHLDTKVGEIVNEPQPISFGCTTRHSVIYRNGYLAALHHDASKINRFPDTINYIIRKMVDPRNLNKRLDQDGGCSANFSVLKRISDIQYFAYLIKSPNTPRGFFLGLGGGAKCVSMSRDLKRIKIYEEPILIFIPAEEFQNFPNLILLSPHFSVKSESAETLNLNFESVEEWMLSLLCGIERRNFKLSMAYFKIT